MTLIGWGIADRLFKGADPLDKQIRIAGVPFTVVGVSKKKGASFGQSIDEFVVIPLGRYQKLFGARQSLALMVKPRDAALATYARDEARVALRVDRGLKPGEPDNFGIVASDSVLGIFQQATAGIAVVLVGIVGLSLLVGGIVIMNIMLMVVSERTREIGLRKALGAKRRDIMSQVLTESITLSMVGGIIGIALGALFSTIISSLTPVPSSVELWSVALGVVITAAVGLVLRLDAGAARRHARSDRSAAARIDHVRIHETVRAAARNRRDGVRHAAQQQDALGADRARRGDRRDVDRRHDVADPRLRHARCATRSTRSARTRSSCRSSAGSVSRRARRSWS